MSKLSKIVLLAALGTSAMLLSSVSMAAGTPLANLFTIDTASEITAVANGTALTTCPTGNPADCTDLPGTSAGIAMRTVDDGVSTFIQTIIADTTGGTFANEQVVAQGVEGVAGGTNIAQKMIIDDPAQSFHADHTMLGGAYTALVAGTGDPLYILNQSINDTANNVTMKVRVQGTIAGALGNLDATDGNRKVYIDQSGTDPTFGEFAYRWGTSASAYADVYNGVTGTALPVNANENVVALFIHQAVDAGNPTLDDWGLLKMAAGPSVTTAYNLPTAGSSDPNAVFEMDLTAPGSMLTAADPTDGYGVFAAGSPADAIFGPITDTTDFSAAAYLP